MRIAAFALAVLLSPAASAQDDDDDERRRRRRAVRDETPAASTSSGGGAISPQGRTFGLGLQLGAPTAITIKYMVAPDQGLVAGLGFGLGWDPSLSLHVDYVWHPSVLASLGWGTFSWYVGGGGWLAFNNGWGWRARHIGWTYNTSSPFALGVRVPIGVQLAFVPAPFEVYLEGDPMLVVFPTIGFGLGATLGGRFYF